MLPRERVFIKGLRRPSNAIFPELLDCGTLLTRKYQQPRQNKSALIGIKQNKVGILMLHPKIRTKILMLLFTQQLAQ
jgi:hypothetical protein